MNAVIVDIRKKYAAALDESGRFIRIRNNGYEIGQQIGLHEVKPVRSAKALKHFSSGVAAAVLIAAIGTGTVYAMPYGTVTLEGEPSVEYTINCFDYVLGVQAVNEEGEALLAEMDISQLRHRRIDRAVTATMEQCERDGYLENTDEPIRISADTRSDDHTERLQQKLGSVAEIIAPPAATDRETDNRIPANSGAPFQPEIPTDAAPQKEPSEDVPANPPDGSHPQGESDPAAENENRASPPNGGDAELPPLHDDFPDDQFSGGAGMMPGSSDQAPVNPPPGRDNPMPAP